MLDCIEIFAKKKNFTTGLRRREEADRSPERPGGQGQHSGGDRAQPGRDQVRELDHRSRARGRERGRLDRGRGHALRKWPSLRGVIRGGF